MADVFPYVLFVAVVVGAFVVAVSMTVSSVRKRLRQGRRGKRGPAEYGPGRSDANPYAPQEQPDPRGWTWLQGPP
jgi:hypothetical protein